MGTYAKAVRFYHIALLILYLLLFYNIAFSQHPDEQASHHLTGIERRHGHYFLYSPEQYAQRLLSENAETVTIGMMDGKGRSCYKSKYLPMINGLSPDYIPELIEHLNKRDIQIYAWVTFNTQDLLEPENFLYDDMFPAWQMEYLPKQPADTYKGMCVVSSPYIRWYSKVLRECAAFDVDGFFFDGFYLMGLPHHGKPGCTCDYCQRAFRDETGHFLPEKVDWSDSSFKRWVRWRNQRLVQVAGYFRDQMREVNPDVNLRFNFNTWPFAGKDWQTAIPLWRINEYGVSQHAFSKQFAEKLVMLGYKCRLSFDMNPQNCDVWRHSRQSDTAGNRTWDPVWHELELRLFMLAGLSYGVTPWRAPGNDIPGNSQILRRINEEMLQKEPYFSKDYIASVAVLNSQNTFDFYGRRDVPSSHHDCMDSVLGTWMLLTENHVPFRFVFDNEIAEAVPGKLKTLILPNAAAISDKAMENIVGWVRRGGHLIAVGQSGSCDAWGNPRNVGLIKQHFNIDPTGSALRRIGAGKVTFLPGAPARQYCRTREREGAAAILSAIDSKSLLYRVEAPAHVITNAFYSACRKKIYLHILNVSPLMPSSRNLYHGTARRIQNDEIDFGLPSGSDRTIGYPFVPVSGVRVDFTPRVKSVKMVSSGQNPAMINNGFTFNGDRLHDIAEIELY